MRGSEARSRFPVCCGRVPLPGLRVLVVVVIAAPGQRARGGCEWVRSDGWRNTTGAGNTDYLLDNADPRAERRFDALGHLFDASTIEYLAAIWVTLGWSCWESARVVGALPNGSPVPWRRPARCSPRISTLGDCRRRLCQRLRRCVTTSCMTRSRLALMTSFMPVCCSCIFPSAKRCSTRWFARFGPAAGS